MTLENRKINTSVIFLSGLLAGVFCYCAAESLIPKQIASPGEHDIFLADRLGFIYASVVSLWLAWLQRSWKRAFTGLWTGVLIGVFYMWLCGSQNFFAIMVGFPCLLGGVLAAILGSNRSPWLGGLGARLGKGLLAGLVLGFVYMITLNLLAGMVMSGNDTVGDYAQNYVKMMWKAGPVALGISSALFFVLMRWAVGLTRVRLIVFEEPEALK